MKSQFAKIQEHLDRGHHCALLSGTGLFYENNYSKILLRAHLQNGGNSYYVYSSQEFPDLRELLESGELDYWSARELRAALADSPKAITLFQVENNARFYPGVVPISTWEGEIWDLPNFQCVALWGESRFDALVEGLVKFDKLQNHIPFLYWQTDCVLEFDKLLQILLSLSIIHLYMDDTSFVIESVNSDNLGGPAGLALFCRVVNVLLQSHLEELGYKNLGVILDAGIQNFWCNLENFRDQDIDTIATALVMVGSA